MSAVLASGCYFDQVQKSEESDIQRVEQKQAMLRAEQERAAKLKQQEDQLLEELSEQQLSWNDLNQRVETLNASNRHSIADTRAKRLEYEDLMQQLHATNDQLVGLQRGEGSSGAEDREARIAALKRQLRTELDHLLLQ
jgi:predicted nuclease with TOPRIM domain